MENKYTCLPLMHRAALAAMQIRPGFLRRTASSVRQPLPPGSPSARSLTADEALGEECGDASSPPSSSSSSSTTHPFVDDEMTACSRFASRLHFSGDSLGSRREVPALIGG